MNRKVDVNDDESLLDNIEELSGNSVRFESRNIDLYK
jgi:hypothetical protein